MVWRRRVSRQEQQRPEEPIYDDGSRSRDPELTARSLPCPPSDRSAMSKSWRRKKRRPFFQEEVIANQLSWRFGCQPDQPNFVPARRLWTRRIRNQLKSERATFFKEIKDWFVFAEEQQPVLLGSKISFHSHEACVCVIIIVSDRAFSSVCRQDSTASFVFFLHALSWRGWWRRRLRIRYSDSIIEPRARVRLRFLMMVLLRLPRCGWPAWTCRAGWRSCRWLASARRTGWRIGEGRHPSEKVNIGSFKKWDSASIFN